MTKDRVNLKLLAMVLFGAMIAGLFAAQANLTVADYCEATLKAQELAELEWKDRIALAESHQGTVKALQSKLQILDQRYGQRRAELCAHYGTSLPQYLRFGASHQGAIKLYLERNSALSNALQDASRRVQNLRDRMDSIMARRRAQEMRE